MTAYKGIGDEKLISYRRLQPVAYAGFQKGGARNFRKFENKDQNDKLFH